MRFSGPTTQIGEGSVNLRLGTHFIVTKAADLPSVKPQDIGTREVRQFQQHVSKSFGETFVLHPHRLVLGATFEYIALPDDYAALVLSRSSYGRVGLIVATATYVQPGWKGCLTLELCNAADIPLELPCGASIAQLVVFRCDKMPPAQLRQFPMDRKHFPTFPEFPSLGANRDWKTLKSFADRIKHL
ncbi:MAG: dCTP deaminase [Phycisphaerales bacterium]|nr:MAG: dCTP deaminase [Phycisphaerales bacterium]